MRQNRKQLVAIGIGVLALAGFSTFAASTATAAKSYDAVDDRLMEAGIDVSKEDFAVFSLVSDDALDRVQETYGAAFEGCMADAGYSVDPPQEDVDDAFTDGYHATAIGDATGDDALHEVVLPGGDRWTVEASWTPNSCFWKASAAIGIADPILDEAIRQRMASIFGSRLRHTEIGDVADDHRSKARQHPDLLIAWYQQQLREIEVAARS
jgi:hypothetical protein